MLEASHFLLDWITFLWATAWAVWAAVEVASRQRRRTVSVLVVVFWVFYGLPLALDLTVGPPSYHNFPGFRMAASSPTAAIVYDLFVCMCPPLWWAVAKPRLKQRAASVGNPGKLEPLLWLLAASPLAAVPFAPNPAVYFSYAAVIRKAVSGDFQMVIGALSGLSVMAGAGLLLVRRHFGRTMWLVLPLMSAAVWMQGKRSMIMLALVLIWSAASLRGVLTRARMIAFGVTASVLFLFYTQWYQAEFRPTAVMDSDVTYQNTRIDWGRDHDLKSAIFCELSKGAYHILDHPGQTFLFYATIYVPRSIWPAKPLPYAPCMTAFSLRRRPHDLGWGVTTSFLDEALANLGWLGLLAGPLMFAVLCRLADGSDELGRMMGGIIVLLLLTVEITAFAPLFGLWVAYIAWQRAHSRGRRRHQAPRFAGFVAAASCFAISGGQNR